MRYTKDKPIERGWYWYIAPGQSSGRLEFVSQRPGHAYLCIQVEPSGFSMKREFVPVARMHGHWVGPLVEPEVPVLECKDDGNEHF